MNGFVYVLTDGGGGGDGGCRVFYWWCWDEGCCGVVISRSDSNNRDVEIKS